jgi:hypothetical protein
MAAKRPIINTEADEDEPLIQTTSSVQAMGRGDGTPYVSPTSPGAEVAGIVPGDQVNVEVFKHGVWITPRE